MYFDFLVELITADYQKIAERHFHVPGLISGQHWLSSLCRSEVSSTKQRNRWHVLDPDLWDNKIQLKFTSLFDWKLLQGSNKWDELSCKKSFPNSSRTQDFSFELMLLSFLCLFACFVPGTCFPSSSLAKLSNHLHGNNWVLMTERNAQTKSEAQHIKC